MTIHTRDRFLSVGGVDLTSFTTDIEVKRMHAAQESTTTGDGNKTYSAGLKDYTLTVEFQQSYAASELHQTLAPLIGTAAAVIARPSNGGAVQVSGDFLISEYTIITGGKPDDIDAFSVTWQPAGSITETNS